MKTDDYGAILKILSSGGKLGSEFLKILDSEISMPNIPMKTMGGHVWWITIAKCNGWKLQQNTFTHHARILDSNDKKIAWGTINGMDKVLDRLVNMSRKFSDR